MKNVFTEKSLVEIAQKASINAVREALSSGGSVTFQKGKRIITEHSDGHIVVLRTLEKAYFIPTRKRIKL